MATNHRIAKSYNTSRAVESINFKLAVILTIIIIGIASNAYRSWVDQENREKTQIIQKMQERIKDLNAKLTACESGTPQPNLRD